MKPKFTIGVFGIIFDEQKRVLLCHRRDYDLWNLPGGSMESGESPWDGVKREVREETGLNVEILKLKGIYSKPDQNEIVFSFICRPVNGRITLNDEADKIEYFEISKLPSNTSLKQVERIKDALIQEGETIYKVQTGKSSIELIKEGGSKIMYFPYGEITTRPPQNFSPPELWPEYVHIAMPRTVCAREEVGGKQTGGPMGIRWSIWPLTFEEYITDSEPVIDNSGVLARNRAVMWKRLHDGPVPKGWHKLSSLPWRVDGFVELAPDTDYKTGWYKQARRDLRLWEEKFLNKGYTIEPVSLQEYERAYARSTVRKKVGLDPLQIMRRKYATRTGRDTMALWGVRNKSGEIIAGINLRFSPTYQSASYECPFILPEAKKVYAMTALIDHFFKESRKRGVSLLVFNSFWSKGEPKSWKAFSLFKSHFGPTLIAYPPALWKFVRGKLY